MRGYDTRQGGREASTADHNGKSLLNRRASQLRRPLRISVRTADDDLDIHARICENIDALLHYRQVGIRTHYNEYAAHSFSQRRVTIATLCPPNPNELDSATFTSRSTASFGA